MSKESFKTFARNNPELATTVLENKATWQQLYELYEIYGEESNIWNNYLTKKETSLKDIIDTIKNLDLNTFQEGINNIQKAIGLIQSIGIGNNRYEPKSLYKRFEDK